MKGARPGAALAGGLLVASASTRADMMHWYWDVEVNGQASDATRVVVVEAGDHVDIDLLAYFDPYRLGFASAEFSITTGDLFFLSGDVNIDPDQGYGLNPYLLGLGLNGTLLDTDASGVADVIDEVVGFQFHPWYNVDFDRSDPILVYQIAWNVTTTPTGRIELIHGPALATGEFHNGVWGEEFPLYFEYTPLSDALAFVPSPGPCWISGVALVLLQHRRRRR